MRSYIRHPVSVPIQIDASGFDPSLVKVSNLSAGGLSFCTDIPVRVGAAIDLLISYVDPFYQGTGIIVWRREREPWGYEVGVRFANDDEYFRVRMVEQVCQIEKYRQQQSEHGRELSSEEAAIEWINNYASEFDEEAKH